MKKILFITLLLLITLTISACNNISNIPGTMEANALEPPLVCFRFCCRLG